METSFPQIIENCLGEKLIFHEVLREPDGDRVIVENFVAPGQGPLMHTHFLQDEELTVVDGSLGYQIMGQEHRFAGKGESVFFKRGTPHRFWNAGQGVLNCRGWVKPANTIVFYLSAIYAAQNKSGKAQPEMFDGAYMLTRYSSEYDLPEIPWLVKKAVLPLTYLVGKVLGKYKHFKDAPAPVKS